MEDIDFDGVENEMSDDGFSDTSSDYSEESDDEPGTSKLVLPTSMFVENSDTEDESDSGSDSGEEVPSKSTTPQKKTAVKVTTKPRKPTREELEQMYEESEEEFNVFEEPPPKPSPPKKPVSTKAKKAPAKQAKPVALSPVNIKPPPKVPKEWTDNMLKKTKPTSKPSKAAAPSKPPKKQVRVESPKKSPVKAELPKKPSTKMPNIEKDSMIGIFADPRKLKIKTDVSPEVIDNFLEATVKESPVKEISPMKVKPPSRTNSAATEGRGFTLFEKGVEEPKVLSSSAKRVSAKSQTTGSKAQTTGSKTQTTGSKGFDGERRVSQQRANSSIKTTTTGSRTQSASSSRSQRISSSASRIKSTESAGRRTSSTRSQRRESSNSQRKGSTVDDDGMHELVDADEDDGEVGSGNVSRTNSSESIVSTVSVRETRVKSHHEKKVNALEEMEKQELLYQFYMMHQTGVPLRKVFTEKDSLDEMRFEYHKLRSETDINDKVKLGWNLFSAGNSIVELVNQAMDPFKIDAQGWANHLDTLKNEYEPIMRKIYKNMSYRFQIRPGMQLLGLYTSHLLMFFLPKVLERIQRGKIDKNALPHPHTRSSQELDANGKPLPSREHAETIDKMDRMKADFDARISGLQQTMIMSVETNTKLVETLVKQLSAAKGIDLQPATAVQPTTVSPPTTAAPPVKPVEPSVEEEDDEYEYEYVEVTDEESTSVPVNNSDNTPPENLSTALPTNSPSKPGYSPEDTDFPKSNEQSIASRVKDFLPVLDKFKAPEVKPIEIQKDLYKEAPPIPKSMLDNAKSVEEKFNIKLDTSKVIESEPIPENSTQDEPSTNTEVTPLPVSAPTNSRKSTKRSQVVEY
jgi:hypothetical protein